MIIRKPTKIELKHEEDYEEYEQYKDELNENNKLSRNQDSAFGSDFAISLSTNNRTLNQPLQPNRNNDRTYIGEPFQNPFQTAFQQEYNFRQQNVQSFDYLQQSVNLNSNASGVINYNSLNQGQFERIQNGINNPDTGQINQIFSALMGGVGRMSATGNPNNPSSLNNSKNIKEEDNKKEIQQEIENWKKNSPFLYDILITQKLEWPSLTVQWFPQKEINQTDNNQYHKLLLATHTSQQEKDYLLIANVTLPSEKQEIDEKAQHKNMKNLINIEKKIMHENESNRARIMPQNSNIIASKIINGEVHIFNLEDEGTENEIKYSKLLKGHTKEGYGLQWNEKQQGYILSGGYDKRVCVWDISGQNQKPIFTAQKHKDCVEDVSWQKSSTNIFASVGDDQQILIWDIRQQKPAQIIEQGHDGEIYCIDFNQFDDNLFITGSEDNTVNLWDLRDLSYKLHSFEGHTEQVVRCEWNPLQKNIFGSCSNDRRIIVWDLKRCGQEIQNEDLQDGAPELLFMHAGHSEKVSDFSWNFNENYLIASVEENNMLQVWQMNDNIYEDQDNISF